MMRSTLRPVPLRSVPLDKRNFHELAGKWFTVTRFRVEATTRRRGLARLRDEFECSDVRVIRLRRREARAALARKSGLALTRSGRSGAAIGGHAPLSVVLPLRGCAPQLSGVRVSRTMAG